MTPTLYVSRGILALSLIPYLLKMILSSYMRYSGGEIRLYTVSGSALVVLLNSVY
jgi:hypothetical protein